MARELERLEVSARPDLLRVAEEVQDSGNPRVLERTDEAIALAKPDSPSVTQAWSLPRAGRK
jgi:hypothetical protein